MPQRLEQVCFSTPPDLARDAGVSPNTAYFYRDRGGREIDLLLVQDGAVYPIEIKKTASPSSGDVRHFGAPSRLGMPVGQGALVCLVEDWLPIAGTPIDPVPLAAPAWMV